MEETIAEAEDTGANKHLRLRRLDSLELESANLSEIDGGSKYKITLHDGHYFCPEVDALGTRQTDFSWATILKLAFQSIGVVYGDLGTSPLYVYPGIFQDGIKHKDDVLGVLSLILYTLILIPFVKYVFIVLQAMTMGKSILLLMTMLGTSMVIGDGILIPCISVVSAASGIKRAATSLTDEFGTGKVGYSFSPILIVWFLFIGLIGFYNFIRHDPGVIRALNPMYIIEYFRRNKKDAWISLGGVIVCTTGAECMFADLRHFTMRSIQISMCSVVLPSIIFAYIGQAAYLRNHTSDAADSFYKATPDSLYWPMFVVAVAAAMVASQSLISSSFSVIKQSLAMRCFPRVKVIHTSSKYKGQVIIPEINWFLMLACMVVTWGFGTSESIQLSNAYGIAVVFVMTLTSTLLILVMVMIWKTNILLIVAYMLTIGFNRGGYLPLAFSAFLMFILYVWSNVSRRKYSYELKQKVPIAKLLDIATKPEVHRIPGLGLFYSELVEGVPPIFSHYVANVPALHCVLVFVSIKFLTIGRVPAAERFLFRRVGLHDLSVYRCVVRYGYADMHLDHVSFENSLVEGLKEFIRADFMKQKSESCVCAQKREMDNGGYAIKEIAESGSDSDEEFVEREMMEVVERELMMVEALGTGVVYMLGQTQVVARNGASWQERVLINFAYTCLTRNVRQGMDVLAIPHKSLLKVGMTYEL
ncbi:hypothetical protein AMTRI_Chr02g222320 [Amborella trichopoda]